MNVLKIVSLLIIILEIFFLISPNCAPTIDTWWVTVGSPSSFEGYFSSYNTVDETLHIGYQQLEDGSDGKKILCSTIPDNGNIDNMTNTIFNFWYNQEINHCYNNTTNNVLICAGTMKESPNSYSELLIWITDYNCSTGTKYRYAISNHDIIGIDVTKISGGFMVIAEDYYDNNISARTFVLNNSYIKQSDYQLTGQRHVKRILPYDKIQSGVTAIIGSYYDSIDSKYDISVNVLDSSGKIISSKIIDIYDDDFGIWGELDNNNNLIILGKLDNSGDEQVYLAKLSDDIMSISWSIIFGDSSYDTIPQQFIVDNDFAIIVGYEGLYDITDFQRKTWKINLLDRNSLKNETTGGNNNEYNISVIKTDSGGYAEGGNTNSYDLGHGDGSIILLDSNLNGKKGQMPDKQKIEIE